MAAAADVGGVTNGGSVFAYSGSTGLLLYRWDGVHHIGNFGRSVDSAGDVDGDGIPDIVVGAPGEEFGGISRCGQVHVYSGATGGLIRSWHGSFTSEQLGSLVAGAGDVDLDGHADRHWAPGEGEIEWEAVFRALSECPSSPHLVLELRNKPDIPKGFEHLRRLGLAE